MDIPTDLFAKRICKQAGVDAQERLTQGAVDSFSSHMTLTSVSCSVGYSASAAFPGGLTSCKYSWNP